MSDELHEVVKLLVARIESHPQEFYNDLVEVDGTEDRWWAVIRDIRTYGNKVEVEAVNAALREGKLRKAHEAMMDELCNGDERRRKQREAYEEEQKRYAAQQTAMAQAVHNNMNSVYSNAQQYQNAAASQLAGVNSYTSATTALPGTFYETTTDTYTLPNGMKMTKAEVEDNPGLVATIKKALGI